jgi:hypothetical protein
MPAPAGSEGQIGWTYSTRLDNFGQDVFNPIVNNFLRFKSMAGVVAKRTMVTTGNMDPTNQDLQGVPADAIIAPKFGLDPDTNSISRWLAHWLSKAPTITIPTGGTNTRQWVMTPFKVGDTPSATFIDTLTMEGSDNDGYPILIDGARMQEVEVKIANGKIIDCNFGLLACHDTYTSNANLLAVGTYTGKPLIRGHWNQALAGSTLKLKVTAVAGGGFDGTVKCTTAAYAGATTTQIKFDTWYRVILDDGTRLGINRADDLWFCYPSSGATVLAIADEFSFTSQRTLATPSFSTLDTLQSSVVELTAAGTTYYIHTADIKMTRPRKANFVNSKYALTIQKNGPYVATIAIGRDRDDRDFLKKLIDAGLFPVTLKMWGNPIETPANGPIDQLWQIDFPNCQVADVNRDVTTPNTLQETIVISPRRVGSQDIYTHTLINTLAAL